MLLPINYLILIATTIYQAIARWIEDKQSPTGKFVDIGAYKLYLYTIGKSCTTILFVLIVQK
ncbi:hypothetical protein NIES267_05690 [Calothrix parasitica NIES-267]|uniref:Uncharacterized protein n=1 Tax=Calothrix parasitica NIES-267 TaxID=1973488 RepID=A0A1Z4LIU5_9CYAN|nr:hypothetical protein NIES267_05690 [Calothrix parasitica NIES-267]